MVFRRAPSRADNREGVFPRAAAHGFALQQIGVFLCGVVAQFGVEVGHGLHACFRVDRAGPFCHVARHVVKAVGVSPVDARARGDEVAVLRVVALIRLEVGKVAALLALSFVALPREGVALFAACGIFPLYFSRQAIALNEARLRPHAFQQVFRAPSAEGLRLLPCHAHNGVVVVDGRREVKLHVRFVVGVGEIVYPACGVGIDAHDIGVEEIVERGERALDGLAHNLAVLVHVGRVFGNHHHLVGVGGAVCVEAALGGVEAVFAQRRLFVVEHLIAIDHLLGVEHLRAVDGVGDIDAVDGTLLVFRRLAPGNGLRPVEVGLHRLAVAVNLNFVGFVAAVRGVGEAFADDAVAYPLHKLAVHGVGHFRLVHPETIHGDFLRRRCRTPKRIGLFEAHFEETALYFHHTVGGGLCKRCRPAARHLAAVLHGPAVAHAGSEQQAAGCRQEQLQCMNA